MAKKKTESIITIAIRLIVDPSSDVRIYLYPHKIIPIPRTIIDTDKAILKNASPIKLIKHKNIMLAKKPPVIITNGTDEKNNFLSIIQ